MRQHIHQDKQRGFTIIEVMIVLAIAGLIMLIVFLAVPALQRSSRNTQRKNDAASALAGVSEFVNNNGGVLPTVATFAAPPNWVIGTAVTTAQSTAKLGYYTTAASVVLRVPPFVAPGPAADTLTIYEATSCLNATTAQAGSSRQIAAVYGVETSNGYTWQCQES